MSTESYNTNEQEFWRYAPDQLGALDGGGLQLSTL